MGVVVPGLIRVLMPNGQVVVMKLETYLAGVVACEIGANGPLEALKAQAVASRTYAASAHRHPELGADVCTAAHCQEWKRVDPIVAPEVFRAVSETWGIVAIHEGKLIDAFFFEHCDGHTRSSEDVLMPAVPYLQGVECQCGFVALKGHGVGLCQRGAIVMARRGRTFEQILSHYYHGVVVIHTAIESGQKPAPRPIPRAQVPRETAPVEPNDDLKNAQQPAPKPKLRSTRKSPAPLNRPTGPVSPPVVKQPAPVPPEASPVLPGAPEPEQPKPLPIPVASIPDLQSVPTEPPVAGSAPLATAPEVADAETPRTIPPTEPANEPVEQGAPPFRSIEPVVPESTALPVQASNVQSPQPATGVEHTLTTDQVITTRELPVVAEPLGAALVTPVEPVLELPAVPFVHESDLPALHEPVSARTTRIHVDHLPGDRLIAGCLPE
ncbi:MAG: SpoIID/LytB domain-containing protein, partial [Acidobacteriota bacterium]